MKKLTRGLLALALAASAAGGCVTMEQQYQNRAERSTDRQLYSAFYPSPLPAKSGYETQVYDGNIRITQRMATVDFIGEAERKYLAEIEKADPVLDTYLSVAAKRGGKVKIYKGLLNQKFFATAGVLDFWPEYRKMSKEDQAYLEFDGNGRLRSGLIRRAAFSNGSLGIGVYREHFILVGGTVRSAENRVSNRDLEDAYLRDVSSK
jgi:hypothetical protein